MSAGGRPIPDDGLRARMEASLVASWAALAAVAPGARMVGRAAVFPAEPHRSIYNNALAGPGGRDVGAAVRAYREAGIERFAVWVAEGDGAAAAAVARHGLALDESTRGMALDLRDLRVERGRYEPGPADAATVLAINGVAPGLMDGAPFAARTALADGAPAAAVMWHDHGGDRTIFLVATRPEARRRGLAGALMADALLDARDAGCATASLQASPMAEGVYARLGFRDLGRFLEFAPPPE
ncbi:MAG TPA: GNAT family N-acetyltransferase [Capillimicrobium sp.]|jgi:GNAT superfamily N-acetyltransferase